MELSAFEVYLVMQLDSIRTAMAVLGIAIPASIVFILIFSPIILIELPDKAMSCLIRSKLVRAAAAFIFLVFVCSAVGYILIPSTKTAAAMIVVPAIVNNETLQDDAGEFYELAKDALRGALSDTPTAEAGKG